MHQKPQVDILRLHTLLNNLPQQIRPEILAPFQHMFTSADDAKLFRLNPICYAADHGLPEAEVMDLFLHATQAGILTMHWGVVCPMCGDLVRSFATLGKVEAYFECRLCDVKATADLDDFIAVSFDVDASIRSLRFFHPETLSMQEFLGVYRFRYIGTTADHRSYREVFSKFARLATIVHPEQSLTVVFDIVPGSLRLFDFATEQSVVVPVMENATAVLPQAVVFDGRRDQIVTNVEHLSPGAVQVTIHPGKKRRPLIINNMPLVMSVPKRFPETFLTGKRLFTNPTFRALFGSEKIATNAGINIKNLTIIFTDLKGSTELYERVGDMRAFQLVNQHFNSVSKVIVQSRGAVVKTIGDAVMAVFMSPVDAVRASLAMLEAIESINRDLGQRDIILKIGIHSGAAIAVTLNERLDYFGQTVNVAARVQGLADADEICFTEDIHLAAGVSHLTDPLFKMSERMQIKGLRDQIVVHRLRMRAKVAS